MEDITYLDHAATTPLRPEVRDTIAALLADDAFGNPSSAHRLGRAARAEVERARRRVADAMGADPATVVFTSGGTEADNLAVVGAALAARAAGRAMSVAVSAIEHKAVLEAADFVAQLGGHTRTLPVETDGTIHLESVRNALHDGVALISVMWVNNEVGITQPVVELSHLCAEARIPFHTDAVQAVGKVPCSAVDAPGAWLSISGHKIGAPKGVGALIVPDAEAVAPLVRGGGQQSGIRPGTENVLGIAALGIAVELAVAERQEVEQRTRTLRDDLERRISSAIPDVVIHGVGSPRAPHISLVSFVGADSNAVLMHLDLAGICCSSGSACNTGASTPSHVLTALNVPPDTATAAVRFSFAHGSTTRDVDRVVEEVPGIVRRVRALEAAS
jgi:cysteine desulfurase